MNKSDEINDLATALSKAQGEIENASKNSTNPHFKSKYADLAEILNTARPVLSKHGLSITQMPSYDAGHVSVETLLMHGSGQWVSSTVSAPVTKQDAQGVGSAITYCRRYALAAVCGLAQEDDDGNAAVGGGSKKPAAKLVGDKEVEQLRQAVTVAGIEESDLCKKVRIGALEELELSRFAGAMDYLKKLSTGGDE